MKLNLQNLTRFILEHRRVIAFWLVVLLAIVFRFYNLNNLPPGLYEDEAANGLDIFRIFDGDIRPFYPLNNGRESLFFFLQAIFVWLLGNTILALRVAPALVGVLTVIFTYLFTKKLFGLRVALVAGFFIAINPWAVSLSRLGFRAGMVPLVIALTGWLLTLAIANRRWHLWLLTGISFGLGFYTYPSYRVAPLIVLVLLVYGFLFYRRQLFNLFWPIVFSGIFVIISLLPLAYYTYTHQSEVLKVRSNVSFLNPDYNNGQPLVTLSKTIIKTAGMFHIRGDNNYRHNLAGEPMLDTLTGIMLLLGTIWAIKRFKDIKYFSLLIIPAVFLIPEIITAEGIPHALRAVGVLPAVYILAGIGFNEFIRRWFAVFPRNVVARTSGTLILVFVILLTIFANWQRYFVAWANTPKTYEAFSEDAVNIADRLNRTGRNAANTYVLIDMNSNRTVEYLTHSKSGYQRIESSEINAINLADKPYIIVANDVQDIVKIYLDQNNVQYKQHSIYSTKRVGVELYKAYEVEGAKTN